MVCSKIVIHWNKDLFFFFFFKFCLKLRVELLTILEVLGMQYFGINLKEHIFRMDTSSMTSLCSHGKNCTSVGLTMDNVCARNSYINLK